MTPEQEKALLAEMGPLPTVEQLGIDERTMNANRMIRIRAGDLAVLFAERKALFEQLGRVQATCTRLEAEAREARSARCVGCGRIDCTVCRGWTREQERSVRREHGALLEEENRAQRAQLARLTDDYADVCRQLESVVEAAREETAR